MSADKAYLSNDNLELIAGMGATPFIPFKSNSLPGGRKSGGGCSTTSSSGGRVPNALPPPVKYRIRFLHD